MSILFLSVLSFFPFFLSLLFICQFTFLYLHRRVLNLLYISVYPSFCLPFSSFIPSSETHTFYSLLAPFRQDVTREELIQALLSFLFDWRSSRKRRKKKEKSGSDRHFCIPFTIHGYLDFFFLVFFIIHAFTRSSLMHRTFNLFFLCVCVFFFFIR